MVNTVAKHDRIRIYIDGEDKYGRLKALKRVLMDVVVKVSERAPPTSMESSS